MFFRIRLEFFKSFVKKKNFQRKFVSRGIRTGLYAFRGTFQFFVFFWYVYQKASLCPDELIEEVFLWTNSCLRFLFRIWAEYCRTLGTTLQPIVKIASYLYRLIFSWIFFYLEIYKQLDNFFRKPSNFSS